MISRAESGSDLLAVQGLWREYWESFGLPLSFQGFGEELRGSPGVYGAAGGLLLLAAFKEPAQNGARREAIPGLFSGARRTLCASGEEEPAGTIALRRLEKSAGEVKRLYLRPKYRGQGLGRRLLEAVVERASAMGYERLYADTLPVMSEALSLYERAGFERVEAYSSAPTPGAIYLKRGLVQERRSGIGDAI